MRSAGTISGRSTASFESTSNEPIPGEGLVSGGLDESAIIVLRSARIPGIKSVFGSNIAACGSGGIGRHPNKQSAGSPSLLDAGR